MWCWDQTQDFTWARKTITELPPSPCVYVCFILFVGSHCSPPHPPIWALQACVTMPGTSLLFLFCMIVFPKIVLFLNIEQKTRLSYKTALQRKPLKQESGTRCDRPTTHFSWTKGLPAPKSHHVGNLACHPKETKLPGSLQTQLLGWSTIVWLNLFVFETLSLFSPVQPGTHYVA